MKITKTIALLLSVMLVFTACNSTSSSKPEASKLELGNAENLSGELVVSAYESFVYEAFLKEGGEKFMAKHPDTKITIDSLSVMPEMKTMENDDGSATVMAAYEQDKDAEENYRSKVSTQLMSGEGADVYAMDVLSLLSYIENHQVEDLTPYMEQDETFNKSDYQENILEQSRLSGGHYYFPFNYYFNYFSYDNNLMPEEGKSQVEKEKLTLSELLKLNIIPTLDDSSVYQLNYDEEALVGTFIMSEFNKLVDIQEKKAHFNEAGFIDMLHFVRSLKDSKKLPVDNFSDVMNMDDPQAFFEAIGNRKYLLNLEQSFSLFQLLDTSVDKMIFSVTAGGTGMEANPKFAALAANEEGQVSGYIQEGLFINKNSQNKELAWEFIKFIVSDEMQSSPTANFINHSINNKSRTASTEALFTGAKWGMATEKTPEMEKSIEEYNKIIEEASEKITYIYPFGNRLQEIAMEELQNYFSEKISAEDVAEKIQSKVTLYLNE